MNERGEKVNYEMVIEEHKRQHAADMVSAAQLVAAAILAEDGDDVLVTLRELRIAARQVEIRYGFTSAETEREDENENVMGRGVKNG